MKTRIISLVLSLVMVLSVCSPAFSEEGMLVLQPDAYENIESINESNPEVVPEADAIPTNNSESADPSAVPAEDVLQIFPEEIQPEAVAEPAEQQVIPEAGQVEENSETGAEATSDVSMGEENSQTDLPGSAEGSVISTEGELEQGDATTSEPIPENIVEADSNLKEENGEELPAPEEEEQEEIQPVRVIFECTPEEVEIIVYDSEKVDENGNPIVILPEEDGSYLLITGNYVYDVYVEGNLIIKKKEFCVNHTEVVESVFTIYVDMSEYYMSINSSLFGNRQMSNALLRINWDHIGEVGTQPANSEYCACFALAYCRTILDNSVRKYDEFIGVDPNVNWGKGKFSGPFYTDINQSYELIYTDVAKGQPVAIKVNSRGGASQHFVAVVGFENVPASGNLSPSNFLILDPGQSPLKIRNMGSEGYYLLQQEGNYQVMHSDFPNESVPFDSSSGSYLSDEYCTIYPTYGSIEITGSGALNPSTLPCNSETASKYGFTSTTLSDKSLAVGSKVNATGIIKNSEGNYWYRVNLAGTIAYVWANRANWIGYTKPWIDNNSFPTQFSGSQALSGTIVTGGAELKSVQGFVLNGNTTDLSYKSNVYNASPISASGTSYALKSSAVDNGLVFGNLTAGNTYTLVYQVKVEHSRLDASRTLHSGETDTYTLLCRTFQYGDSQTTQYYELDVNAYLDGTYYGYLGDDGEYGAVDVWINGKKVATEVNDYCTAWPSGTTYNIVVYSYPGYQYDGVVSGNLSGTITDSRINVNLSFTKKTMITFDANGGTGAPEPAEVDAEGYFVIPDAVPVREGYDFYGWAYLADATIRDYYKGDQVHHDVEKGTTLYALWRYNAESGVCGDNAQWSFDSTSGRLIIYGSGATYDFRDNEGGAPWSGHKEEILSVYIEDGITYLGSRAFYGCSNLSSVVLPGSLSGLGGSCFGLCRSLENVVIPNGITSIPDGTFTGCDRMRSISIPDSVTSIGTIAFFRNDSLTDIYYYATEEKWNQITNECADNIANVTIHFIDTYTITFDANGGTGAPESVTKQYDVDVDMMDLDVPSRPGYEFGGWSESANATESEFTSFYYRKNQNTVLYAVWWKVSDKVITYNANGGEGAPAAQTVLNRGYFEISRDIPYKEGFDFIGWSKSANAVSATYFAGESVKNDGSDMTLFAVWQRKMVTLFFDANGGTGAPEAITLGAGEEGRIPEAIPEFDGYVFDGWYWEPGYPEGQVKPGNTFTISYDVTLYAIWTTKEIESPQVITHPVNTSAAVGSIAEFTVEAVGNDLTYQWQFYYSSKHEWRNITAKDYTGVQTANMGVTVTAARDGYRYRCIVSNEVGSVTSNEAILTLTETAPVITKQPADTSAALNEMAYFAVEASGDNLSYQWQFYYPVRNQWRNITAKDYTGVQTANMGVTVTEARDGYRFRCIVTNSAGSVTSNEAVLTVAASAAPQIVTQPADTSAALSEMAHFAVEASGDDLSYQWQFYYPARNQWRNITAKDYTGVQTANMGVTVTEARDGYRYRCIVTNSAGSVTSNEAVLTVEASAAPQILTQPADTSAALSEMAYFAVEASGDDLSYQWQFYYPARSQWRNITAKDYTGVQTANMGVTVTEARDGYRYRCIVTNSAGSVTSNEAVLTVGASAAPQILTQPADTSAALNEMAYFAVEASGDDLSYQWQFYYPVRNQWRNITAKDYTGVQTANMGVTVTEARDGYRFRCIVTNGSGSVTSNEASLTVTASAAPQILTQPADTSAALNEMAYFAVEASGDDLSYQWQFYYTARQQWRNITAKDYTGVQAANMGVTMTEARDGYRYRCIVSNSAGSVTSDEAVLTVVAAATDFEIETLAVEADQYTDTEAVFHIRYGAPVVEGEWEYTLGVLFYPVAQRGESFEGGTSWFNGYYNYSTLGKGTESAPSGTDEYLYTDVLLPNTEYWYQGVIILRYKGQNVDWVFADGDLKRFTTADYSQEDVRLFALADNGNYQATIPNDSQRYICCFEIPANPADMYYLEMTDGTLTVMELSGSSHLVNYVDGVTSVYLRGAEAAGKQYLIYVSSDSDQGSERVLSISPVTAEPLSLGYNTGLTPRSLYSFTVPEDGNYYFCTLENSWFTLDYRQNVNFRYDQTIFWVNVESLPAGHKVFIRPDSASNSMGIKILNTTDLVDNIVSFEESTKGDTWVEFDAIADISFGTARNGYKIVLEYATDSEFQNASREVVFQSRITEDHEPLTFRLESLTPGNTYYVRPIITDFNDNVVFEGTQSVTVSLP